MSDEWVVVTGAGRGIGAAIAAGAVDRGYRVAVWDADGDAASAVASELGDSAVAATVDVTDERAVEAAFDQLPAPPAGVVNNAGIVRFGPLLELEVADYEAVLRVNLTGTFVVGRAYARRVGEGGGAIVNIASINGIAAAPFAGGYSSSKAAVVMLTQQMALEWAPLGVRANAVAPGLIDAGMSTPIYADPEIRELRQSKVPLRRLGSAEDVAAAVLYLLSPEAAYVTGQTLAVDGGITVSALGSLARPRSIDRVGS